MAIFSRIVGAGAYLPKKIVSNDDLSKFVDTSDEWIVKRTGIKQRHFIELGETTAMLGEKAALSALSAGNVRKDDIDLIILATTTPDNTFPATAATIHDRLEIKPCAFFDVQAVCSGFIYALAMADNMIRLGQATKALVIGAEIYSKILNWQDRSTCVLFGDGAGAVVLQADNALLSPSRQRGILSTHLFGDGQYRDMLYVNGGVATTGLAGHVVMEGREVFRMAVDKMSECVEIALQKNNLSANDLDILIPHQANARIISKVGERLKLDDDKVIVTVHDHANISAATIPVALHHALNTGKIKQGDIVAFSALGGGFSWGSALLRW